MAYYSDRYHGTYYGNPQWYIPPPPPSYITPPPLPLPARTRAINVLIAIAEDPKKTTISRVNAAKAVLDN